MTDDTPTDDGPRIDRRTTLAGLTGLAGLGALAGCTEEPGENNSTNGDAGDASLDPPRMPFNPQQLDQPMRFVVESLAYQNQMLAAQDGD